MKMYGYCNVELYFVGDAFDACALFIVGLGIVGKFNKTMTSLLMGSGMLIFVKL